MTITLRRGASLVVLLSVTGTIAAPASSKSAELSAALQTVLDDIVALHKTSQADLVVQLGWTDGKGTEIALASGEVSESGGSTRAATGEDKLLFGSGTKPFTAAAVYRLIDSGAISLDDKVATIIDAGLKAANGTTLVGLFGPQAADVTVSHLLHMQSGICDFDTPELDQTILEAGDLEWPPYAVLRAAASQSPTFHCDPGTCTEYSSTNFILLGLVLLANDKRAGNDWTKLDQKALTFPTALMARYSNVTFLSDGRISGSVTVPGTSGMIQGRKTQIYGQRAGVLGWTCGNMVASAIDVAHFMHDLLVEKNIVSAASQASAERFSALNTGWAKGRILYGGGLMVEQVAFRGVSMPPVFSEWGAYMGHGGDTYGYLSEQGIVGKLGNASFSVVSNQDDLEHGSLVQHAVACQVIVAAAKVLVGTTPSLQCGI
jgi:CubicO group peptidase (beta-lactamase class C family)